MYEITKHEWSESNTTLKFEDGSEVVRICTSYGSVYIGCEEMVALKKLVDRFVEEEVEKDECED